MAVAPRDIGVGLLACCALFKVRHLPSRTLTTSTFGYFAAVQYSCAVTSSGQPRSGGKPLCGYNGTVARRRTGKRWWYDRASCGDESSRRVHTCQAKPGVHARACAKGMCEGICASASQRTEHSTGSSHSFALHCGHTNLKARRAALSAMPACVHTARSAAMKPHRASQRKRVLSEASREAVTSIISTLTSLT